MVVKMVVRPIAKLIKTHAQTQAAHCFGIAGRDKGDFGSLGHNAFLPRTRRGPITGPMSRSSLSRGMRAPHL
jgi:hypothetical protein